MWSGLGSGIHRMREAMFAAHRRITKLMADGWIEVRGSGRSTKYVLSTDYGYSGKKEEQ